MTETPGGAVTETAPVQRTSRKSPVMTVIEEWSRCVPVLDESSR
jgi:hypothetical protein